MNRVILAGLLAIVLLAWARAFGDDTMLLVGDVAPEFSLTSDKGDTISLGDFRNSKHVVLIFYPGDQTVGCTKQLCAIRDDYTQFERKNAVVLGVNPADARSHKVFSDKNEFQFPLLVDPGKKVATQYGAGGIMIKRTVYVIDKKGTIVFAQRGMPSTDTILSSIKTEDQ